MSVFARAVVPFWQAVETYAPPLTPLQEMQNRACLTGIEFICGLPGGGKSMQACRVIVEELMTGHRVIVTNLALKLGRLQEYLHEQRFNVHVMDRVKILTVAETYEFFRYRGLDLVLDLPASNDMEMDWSRSQRDETAAGGVFYVLDEVHKFFGGDKKIEVSSPIFMYASQHRKLKDVVYFVTQCPENVHIKIRRLAHKWNYVRFLAKEKFKGFRKGNGFRCDCYRTMKTTGTEASEEGYDFKMDADGLASCYDTAAGVGVAGIGVADGGARVKGMHMRWIWVAGAVIVSLVGVGLWMIPKTLSHVIIGHTLGKEAMPGHSPAPKLGAKQGEVSPPLAPSPGESLFLKADRVDAPTIGGVMSDAHQGMLFALKVHGRTEWLPIQKVDGSQVRFPGGILVPLVDVQSWFPEVRSNFFSGK